MPKTFFSATLAIFLAALPMLAQNKNPWDKPSIPFEIRIGSIYSVDGGSALRIKSGEILPVSIAIKNNNIPKQISLLFKEVNDEKISPVKPIPNGFEILNKNPSEKIDLDAHECKIFKANIKINSDKQQCVHIYIYTENYEFFRVVFISINNPQNAKRRYIPFDESKLCNFDDDPNIEW
jgi:hypothetical protein